MNFADYVRYRDSVLGFRDRGLEFGGFRVQDSRCDGWTESRRNPGTQPLKTIVYIESCEASSKTRPKPHSKS